ncbi:hypothetical protein ACMU_08940 [Actibacterium mucosum KCTC 23349]|uniref:Uncharacterized protein n=1 Tax=Actibacterium mucosum KCTC 23349 TaxID=1454373 RepID=A0A037ZJV4_9RHOB|nr:hypothetical protein [Actibacterium mucosum]KAJ55884.1 hypothetical protein ACMU_08940 [Actibacterium mucosum KCTC 23349]
MTAANANKALNTVLKTAQSSDTEYSCDAAKLQTAAKAAMRASSQRDDFVLQAGQTASVPQNAINADVIRRFVL